MHERRTSSDVMMTSRRARLVRFDRCNCAVARSSADGIATQYVSVKFEHTYIVGAVELFFAFDQLLFLVGKVDVLIERFLVYVAVLLELLVGLIELLEKLQTKRRGCKTISDRVLICMQPASTCFKLRF